MVDLVTPASDLTTLNLEQINWLIDEAGSELTALSVNFVEVNASDEAHYKITYFSVPQDGNVEDNVFVDFDLQGDPRAQINEVEAGDMWLRRTEEEIAADSEE